MGEKGFPEQLKLELKPEGPQGRKPGKGYAGLRLLSEYNVVLVFCSHLKFVSYFSKPIISQVLPKTPIVLVKLVNFCVFS